MQIKSVHPPGEQISVPAGPGGRAGVVWGRRRELGLQQQKHFLEMYFPRAHPSPDPCSLLPVRAYLLPSGELLPSQLLQDSVRSGPEQ